VTSGAKAAFVGEGPAATPRDAEDVENEGNGDDAAEFPFRGTASAAFSVGGGGAIEASSSASATGEPIDWFEPLAKAGLSNEGGGGMVTTGRSSPLRGGGSCSCAS
jgi:hypothetical protein